MLKNSFNCTTLAEALVGQKTHTIMSAATNSDVPKVLDPNSAVLEDTSRTSSQQSGEEQALSPTASDEGFDYRYVPLDLFSDTTLSDLSDGFLGCFVPELAKTMKSFKEMR